MPAREQVQTWLDAYVDAWRGYDEAAIRALFADPDSRGAAHRRQGGAR